MTPNTIAAAITATTTKTITMRTTTKIDTKLPPAIGRNGDNGGGLLRGQRPLTTAAGEQESSDSLVYGAPSNHIDTNNNSRLKRRRAATTSARSSATTTDGSACEEIELDGVIVTTETFSYVEGVYEKACIDDDGGIENGGGSGGRASWHVFENGEAVNDIYFSVAVSV